MQFKAKKSELSKHFINLKDGDQVVGVFMGEPAVHYTHWGSDDKRSYECSENEDCKGCRSTDGEGKPNNRKKFRFRLNMAVKGDNGLEARILEGGWKLYNTLSELNVEFPLENGYTKIKRTGKTMNDTVYTALPVPNIALSETTKAELKKLELLPLSPKDKFWNRDEEGDFNVGVEEVPF